MPRTKNSTKSSDSVEEGFPKWVEDELNSIQFKPYEVIARSGYILSIGEKEPKIDIQIYEPLPDGRTILEGLVIPANFDINNIKKGVVYEFKINSFRGDLSQKASEFLKSTYSLAIPSIYTFEILDLQEMDVASDEVESISSEDDDE